jgi:hypothetical protein
MRNSSSMSRFNTPLTVLLEKYNGSNTFCFNKEHTLGTNRCTSNHRRRVAAIPNATTISVNMPPVQMGVAWTLNTILAIKVRRIIVSLLNQLNAHNYSHISITYIAPTCFGGGLNQQTGPGGRRL